MEDGPGARAFLAKAAAAFTVLSLLPVALSGSAPSHASPALRPISSWDLGGAAPVDASSATPLFASFTYDRGQVRGTYVQFTYDAPSGMIRSILGLGSDPPILYVGSIRIQSFIPPGPPTATALGPIFEAEGFLVTVTAHDDPTGLLEIHSGMRRLVTIELPASASNISLQTSMGAWPASSVSFTVGGEHARFVLGAGSFSVNGTVLVADMAGPDLLVFKSVPPGSSSKAEWRAILDAISAGQVVAELDLVATQNGGWIQNAARYRIDVAAWPVAVKPGQASVYVDSNRTVGAVVLLAFDQDTMPVGDQARLSVRANGNEVNRTNDTLTLLYAPDARTKDASYTILPLPGTVLAIYLPSLVATYVEVMSVPPPPPGPAFDFGAEAATIAALAVVSVAAAHMFRRRKE